MSGVPRHFVKVVNDIGSLLAFDIDRVATIENDRDEKGCRVRLDSADGPEFWISVGPYELLAEIAKYSLR